MIPIKILLVEDSPTQAAFSKQELQTIGPQVTVEVARSSAQALEIIATQGSTLDLAILDMNLPDGSGLELCRMLKSSEATHHVPTVIFSTEALSKQRQAAYEAGADHYISKGGTGDTALRLVASTLLRNKLRRLPRLGEALIERGYIKMEQLQRALNTQKPPAMLGQILVETGQITQAQLDEVLQEQKVTK